MRNDDTTKAVYEGNGVTTRWSIPFDYFAESEIHVLLTVTVAGLEQETEVDSDSFTIDGDAKEIVYPNSAGEEPVPAGTKLTVYRSTDTLQQADYTNQGAMWPETLEGSLDKIHQVLQEHSEGLARSFTVSMSSNKTPKEYADELIAGSIAAVEAASAAAQSETNAATSATSAAASATAALASQQAAAISENNAAASATAAAQSAADLETAVQAAAASASAAAGSATAAATSETNAAASASAALTSQQAAANSASAAALSETNAGTSATNAANSATAAAASATHAGNTAASIDYHAGYRQPSTAYADGAMATHHALPYGWYIEATTGGITSASDLVITSPAIGDTVTDGTVVWTVHKIGSVADIPIATEETNGLMSAEDKTKLDSIVIDDIGDVSTKTYRWGIRIDKRNSDPNTRCEYIFDAKGMGPAGMDFTNGVFNYGDWADLWFVKNNRPCMLKSDGTVDYYLDPNDYTKKEDGTPSDVGNPNYDGNAMAEIPLVWVKRWEDGRYEYEVISDTQYDETYHAYAHTRADGTIADKFYFSMFGGSGNATKIRSLSGQSVSQSLTTDQQIAGASANGAGWYIHSWSQRELIRTLCILMGCSTDTQSVFGNGNCRSASSASGLLATGTLKDKGQFYGYNNTNQVKVFHIEEFWGNQWDRTAGLINDRGKIYVKMTPEDTGYRVTDVIGYTDTGLTAPAGSGSYINGMHCDEHGMIPKLATGSGSTYYCDGYWTNNGQLNYLVGGAGAGAAAAFGGAFTFGLDYAPAHAGWYIGCGLSYL